MTVPADQYAVMGNPIEHSKSPIIHTLFAARTGEAIRYEAELVELWDFKDAVARFFENKGRGLNITVPFKQEAWELASQLTERARLSGAVNTLWQDDNGELWGDTTDGVGLVRDITVNHQSTIAGKNVLVLGAGGAVRGVLEPLLAEKPAQVVIANRTVSRADELAKLFADYGKLTACGFTEAEGPFDLVINGTSASLQGECPPLPPSAITPDTIVYDMMYGATDTAFIQWAKDQGAVHTMDGLGMLVEQAAESFFIWRGVRPDTQEIVEEIRQYLL
ncbi:shikimate dehydrogenase [Parendozoicomonas haliclonae]|uniref:Shikimate dehydrogenase (NADP(+)) n=1 Tax=Parendozoicomonas haliclonae TaxID=1960125 RepID=A0A1X7AJT0_9GAMM|nr:shikimate dehydrogenase [Parendozoicomonas haliclonae]SMA46393.1 Shikimate dehydrogenase [Parendozoicomonas haliclonae]